MASAVKSCWCCAHKRSRLSQERKQVFLTILHNQCFRATIEVALPPKSAAASRNRDKKPDQRFRISQGHI